MTLKGFKQPLVQEDMWNLNEADSTAFISRGFEHHMQVELAAARIRYQGNLKKKKNQSRDKAQDDTFKDGPSNGLGKGISQDVLMMVKYLLF